LGVLAILAIGVVGTLLVTGGGGGKGSDTDNTGDTTVTNPSAAMEPTLKIGQRLAVNSDAYDGADPRVGDIVLFTPPSGAESGAECGVAKPAGAACPIPTAGRASVEFVKRIVAGPGDTLAITDGHPVINGVEKTDEPYINAAVRDPPATCRRRSPFRRAITSCWATTAGRVTTAGSGDQYPAAGSSAAWISERSEGFGPYGAQNPPKI
jgi:signal peptidase I